MNEKEIKDKAFEIFAMLHPVEAYDRDPVAFCEYMQEKFHFMTNEEVKILIDEAR